MALISALVGAAVEAKAPEQMPNYRSVVLRFGQRDRLVQQMSYHSDVKPDGTYAALTLFVFDDRYQCVEVGDVLDTLGPPTRTAKPRGSHIPATAREYVYATNGVRASVVFLSSKCANSLDVATLQKPKGGR
jgi:hypothetical protein